MHWGVGTRTTVPWGRLLYEQQSTTIVTIYEVGRTKIKINKTESTPVKPPCCQQLYYTSVSGHFVSVFLKLSTLSVFIIS